jgi:hypothetical protein
VKVFIPPEKESLEAMAMEFLSSRSVRTWKSNFATFIDFHVAQFFDAKRSTRR